MENKERKYLTIKLSTETEESTIYSSQETEEWMSRYGDILKARFHTHPYGDHKPSKPDKKIKKFLPKFTIIYNRRWI